MDMNELFDGRTLVSVQEAQKVGVSRALLSYWVKTGKLKRIAQGYYSLPEEIEDELVLISRRSPKLVFSHETALALHRLHNRIPERPTVTIPTGASVPRSISQDVLAYRVKPEWHDIGRTELVSFQGNAVPCYDLERTICDVIRSYSRMDVESYAGALKSYAERKDMNVARLFEYARRMKVEQKVHKVMEILI